MTQSLRQIARILVVLLLWNPLALSWFGLASAYSQDREVTESIVQPLGADGPSYVVGTFEAQYVRGLPFLPPVSELGNTALPGLEINLSSTADGYVAHRSGSPTEQLTIQQLTASGPIRLYASAIDEICQAIAQWFRDQPGSLDVLVAPSPNDIDPTTGQDLRPRKRTKLRLLISYEGPSFQISRLNLSYSSGDHPEFPPLDEVLTSAEASLTQTDAGYVAWRPDIEPMTFRPADLSGDRAETFTAGAIQMVLEGVLKYLTDREFMAVQVVPAEGQLDLNRGRDLREGRTELDLLIITGLVTQVRTLASGDRIPLEERENNSRHAFIRASSPFQPYEEGDEPRRDILKKDELDDFLFRLSRHPGRRVDASLAPATETYGVSLDYLVSENKEILFYSQLSNTGTKQTDKWRYRFGLFHNQLTGNDDLFSFEYVTAGFDESHALNGSYEARVFDSDSWRWRTYASWSQFTASEVGFADERFTGESWQIGAELAWNFFQDRQLFLDLVGGARYENIKVDNQIVSIRGEEDFFLPYAGLRLQRYTEEARTDVSATVEWNIASVTDVDRRAINRLGRLFPDDDWTVLRWDVAQTFYLEPLLRSFRADSSQPPSLAHEIALRFRGQYAFDNRLIPQEEQVAGGLYSVRGYPESVVVGDSVLLGTVEYRFHVAHAFGFDPNPTKFLGKSFRWRPQYAYGPADWDLILRGFLDIGHTFNSDPFSFEKSRTLIGTGIGFELQYRSNLSVRVDWGFALEDIPGQVDSGSSEVHFVATIVY